MDISKATGADNISAKVLKTAAPYISNVVSNILNACYQYSRFPSWWKTAKVTTLFKGRFKTDRDNRRPISVLPCILKAQEIFANLDLQEFAAENNLIGDHQFAYVRNWLTINSSAYYYRLLVKVCYRQRRESCLHLLSLEKGV